MTDIVEKLLSLPRVFSNSSPIMKEAADTITALRTALAVAEERAEKAENHTGKDGVRWVREEKIQSLTDACQLLMARAEHAESLVARFVEACGQLQARLEGKPRFWAEIMRTEKPDSVLRNRSECWMLGLGFAAQEVKTALASLTAEAKGE